MIIREVYPIEDNYSVHGTVQSSHNNIPVRPIPLHVHNGHVKECPFRLGGMAAVMTATHSFSMKDCIIIERFHLLW